jgi:hypothetical protein
MNRDFDFVLAQVEPSRQELTERMDMRETVLGRVHAKGGSSPVTDHQCG